MKFIAIHSRAYCRCRYDFEGMWTNNDKNFGCWNFLAGICIIAKFCSSQFGWHAIKRKKKLRMDVNSWAGKEYIILYAQHKQPYSQQIVAPSLHWNCTNDKLRETLINRKFIWMCVWQVCICLDCEITDFPIFHYSQMHFYKTMSTKQFWSIFFSFGLLCHR